MAYYYEITVKARLAEEILDIAEMLNLEVDKVQHWRRHHTLS